MKSGKNKDIVYHGSSFAGLKRLEPFKCKHEKAYVYATKYYWVVLFFSAKGKGKYDGWLDAEDDGTPIFYEARPNAFKERYSGKSGFCYKLPADTFTDATGDPTELVSETGVDVISCKEIKDIGDEFEKLIQEGKFNLVAYNTSNDNTEEICNQYILKLLEKRGYFAGKDVNHKVWISEYYKDLISNYQNINQKL